MSALISSAGSAFELTTSLILSFGLFLTCSIPDFTLLNVGPGICPGVAPDSSGAGASGGIPPLLLILIGCLVVATAGTSAGADGTSGAGAAACDSIAAISVASPERILDLCADAGIINAVAMSD